MQLRQDRAGHVAERDVAGVSMRLMDTLDRTAAAAGDPPVTPTRASLRAAATPAYLLRVAPDSDDQVASRSSSIFDSLG